MAKTINLEKKLKHLEFVQLVITRMGVNSFLLKGWSVTLIAALFAFAAKDSNINYVLITYISTPMFWLLDGYFLSQERQYRKLYDTVRQIDENNIDFDLNARVFNKGRNTWIASMFSPTILIFYGTLSAVTLVVMFIIK
jgi:hypothetical protein